MRLAEEVTQIDLDLRYSAVEVLLHPVGGYEHMLDMLAGESYPFEKGLPAAKTGVIIRIYRIFIVCILYLAQVYYAVGPVYHQIDLRSRPLPAVRVGERLTIPGAGIAQDSRDAHCLLDLS